MRLILTTFLLVISCGLSAGVIDSLEAELSATTDADTRLLLISKMLENTIFEDSQAAHEYVDRFKVEAEKSGIAVEVARGFNFEGMLAYIEGRHMDAIHSYSKSAEMYQQTDNKFMIGMMQNNIAALYEGIDQEKSMSFYERALEIFSEVDTLEWEARVIHNMAGGHMRLGDLEEAKLKYELAIDKLYDSTDTSEVTACHLGIARVLKRQEKYDESLKVFFTCYERSQKEGLSSQVQMNIALCDILTVMGRTDEAAQYCLFSERNVESLGTIKELSSCSRHLYAYYKAIGNNAQALANLERHKAVQDSLLGEEKLKVISEMTAKYETSENLRRIEAQKVELAQNEMESKFFTRLLAVLSLLVIGAIFFIWSRVRTNMKLRAQKVQIEKSLSEKELLLREIHHRVKNNLQVVSSLLSIQSREIEDEKALEAVNESRNRVKSMSLIHQNLYQDDDLTGIEVKSYIEKLSKSLFRSYRLDNGEVELLTDIDDLKLDVDTIIPLGLIINELLSNALKYAFPDGRSGEILVNLKVLGDSLKLTVADTGIGALENIKRSDGTSFGMKMIQAFADKLDATWDIVEDSGTKVELVIKKFTYIPQP
jgi:two-component sensor histidine kinase